ncbi:MAG: glycosyltransferase [Acidimicrobiales bacterium]
MDAVYLIPIGLLGLVRWISWFLRRIPAVLYRPMTTGHREPLSVVVPVYQEDPVIFRRAIDSWIASRVDEIVLVIDVTDRDCRKVAARYGKLVRVVVTDVAGKRDALRRGWEAATSPLVALVDSDTIWASDVADLVCEPFADPRIGGVGTRQNVLNPRGLWQRTADLYLDYRYFDEIAGQTVMGQAVSCLSGRTAVYRRSLLLANSERFMAEKFMGVQCMSGDDKRLTTLTLEAGYRTFLQRSARVWSTFPRDPSRFFRQRVRWARNTWRSDLRALCSRWVWRHPFLALSMMDKAVGSVTLLVSASFMVLALSEQAWLVAGILATWWLVSRSAKMLPHLERCPRDIWLMPVFILLSFAMAVVKLYALLTIRKQKWLTRQVAVVDGIVVRTGADAPVEARVAG